VHNSELASAINLFPNPATNTLNVASGFSAFNSITFTNPMGQKVARMNINGNNNAIDISSFAPGVYIADIELQNGAHTFKQFRRD
jgi:Secretion system C-terminal sorting domain